MTAAEFEERILKWVQSRTDVEAVIQIGSRAQSLGLADEWSDWDYQLIVKSPPRLHELSWLNEIAPCWAGHLERTERQVHKVSAIFEGGLEADFVLLHAWQMKLVFWAMAHPEMSSLFPARLVAGIANTRLIAGPGYRVVAGGDPWRKRLAALNVSWPEPKVSDDQIRGLVSGFWRHAVWVQKKISRGELRAAQRWFHLEVAERRWKLLEIEARGDSLAARPEARRAEWWLSKKRLDQTSSATSAEQQLLARALLAEISLFEELSARMSQMRSLKLEDYTGVARWLRDLLTPLARDN